MSKISNAANRKILVIDDSSTMRGATTAVLQHAGYETLEANDGALALQVVEQERNVIKLIICDVNMPIIIEFLKEYNEHSPQSRNRILALSNPCKTLTSISSLQA